MAKTDRLSSSQDVFRHETEVLKKATEIDVARALPHVTLQGEYNLLVNEYQKLLLKTSKITRVGDSSQKKLFSAYEKIENQNHLLTEARQEADRANKAKSNFLAIMSHEIRTPMNVILGMTELTLATPLNEKQQDYLETVQKASQSLLKVIEDILDFSKIEAGKLFLEKIDFNLKETLDLVVKMMGLPALQKGLALHCHIAPDVPLILSGDFERLKQILVNLVGNAIKFTDSGHIQIDVQRYDTGADNPTETAYRTGEIPLIFFVRDTGIGVPEEKRDSIFESFSQADRSTTRQYGGTGLGLTICKQLVELMKGSIRIESREPKGSQFIFTAVFSAGNPAAVTVQTTKSATNREPSTPLHILLAEDNPTNAKLALVYLEKLGHHVCHVTNGREVLNQLPKEVYDLVLMDLEMPEMDGYEAANLIRSDTSGTFAINIPIVALTAHSMVEYREKVFHCGMNELITKPIDFDKLALVLAKLKYHEHPVPQNSQSLEEPQNRKFSYRVLNANAALGRIGNDMDMYQKFCVMVFEEIPDIKNKLHAALQAGDFEMLRKHAHYLKGSAATIGAEKTSHHAALLEHAAHNQKDLKHATALLGKLDSQLHLLIQTLGTRISAGQ